MKLYASRSGLVSYYNKNSSFKRKTFLLYLHSTVLPVRRPMEGIRAVFDNITCHILIEILSSLCGDLHNLLRPPQVILYPLSSSVDLRRPSTNVATTLLVVEPCQPGGVVLVPDARCCYVTVVEAVVGDSKRFSDWKWSF